MKKNTLVKLLAVLVMCFMIGAVLVACGEAEVGPKGDKGDKGDTGAPGANGTNGVDGLTPHIGENGNWWIGETDTGVYAQGPKGDKGDAGENLADCAEHDWDDDIVISEHTYDAVTGVATEGITLNICTLCGDAKVTWVNHSYDHEGGINVVAPTCTTAGYTEYACECGYTGVNLNEGDAKDALDHGKPAFDAAAVDTTVWTFAEYKPGTENCPCLMTPLYVAECTNGCGELVGAEGTPAGHNWGPWIDTVPDLDVYACERDVIQVANCTNNGCAGHTDDACKKYQVVTPAPGHSLSAEDFVWVKNGDVDAIPSFVSTGMIIATCECGKEFPVELPALVSPEYVVEAVEGKNCGDADSAIYSYTFKYNTGAKDAEGKYIEEEITYSFENKLGHAYSAESVYTTNIVSIVDGVIDGTVTITCDDCGAQSTYALPANALSREYNYVPGKCTYQKDTYTVNISGSCDELVNRGMVSVTFTYDVAYAHDAEPAELTVVYGEEKVYQMYYCAQGNHYVIVRTFDNKAAYEAWLAEQTPAEPAPVEPAPVEPAPEA